MIFPPVGIHVTVQAEARYGRLRKVWPWADRQPNGDWCVMFYEIAEKTPGLDWQGAGFARCKPEDVPAAESLLHKVAEQTNERFARFLETAEPRHAARELLTLENINAASTDADNPGAYWIRHP